MLGYRPYEPLYICRAKRIYCARFKLTMNKELLYRCFAGEVTDGERAMVRRWVEASPDNAEEYMAQRRFYDITGVLGDELFTNSDAQAPRPTATRSIWRRVASYAAAVAAAVVVTLGVEHAGTADSAPMAMQTLRVPPGQRLNITLADGTEVWLNSASTLRFPGAFTGGERRIELDGEAYLTVAHDSSHPFRVDTYMGEVEVTGTVFNVDAYAASSDFAVALSEGSVHFSDSDTDYDITAGHTLRRMPDGALAVISEDNTVPDWVEGIVSFNDLTLPQILTRFEKYYGVTITYDGDICQSERFSGKFYLEDGAEHALNALRHDIDFDFDSDRDFHTITIRYNHQ